MVFLFQILEIVAFLKAKKILAFLVLWLPPISIVDGNILSKSVSVLFLLLLLATTSHIPAGNFLNIDFGIVKALSVWGFAFDNGVFLAEAIDFLSVERSLVICKFLDQLVVSAMLLFESFRNTIANVIINILLVNPVKFRRSGMGERADVLRSVLDRLGRRLGD